MEQALNLNNMTITWLIIGGVLLVFALVNRYNKSKKEKIIYDNQHLILKSGHPSPLSANRGFWFGNKHFSKCNDFLIKHKLKYIKW